MTGSAPGPDRLFALGDGEDSAYLMSAESDPRYMVASFYYARDAQEVLHRWNAHEALVAALETIRDGVWSVTGGKTMKPRDVARAALAAARRGSDEDASEGVMSAAKLPDSQPFPSMQASETVEPHCCCAGGQGRSAERVARDGWATWWLGLAFAAGFLCALAVMGDSMIGWAP